MNARRAVFAGCLTALAGATLVPSASSRGPSALPAAPAAAAETTPDPATRPAASSATEPFARPATHSVLATQPYVWRQVNDAASGDCTGIYFHSQDASIRYVASARGGGGSFWDYPGQRWVGFTVHPLAADGLVGPNHILGMAVDSTDRNIVHIVGGAAGGGGSAEVYRSTDQGRTFVASGLRLPGGGRVDGDLGWGHGPATGERLVTDPNNPAVLYFASPRDGLFRTAHGSAPGSWEPVPLPLAAGDSAAAPSERVVPDDPKRLPPVRLTAVAIDSGSGTVDTGGVRRSRVVYIGVTTSTATDLRPPTATRPATRATTRATSRDRRGADPTSRPLPDGRGLPNAAAGIWRTTDGGETWDRLGGPPAVAATAPTRLAVRRDGTLWATVAGQVVRAPRESAAVTDVTPPARPATDADPADEYVALAIDAADPMHAVVARYGIPRPDEPAYGEANRLYRTTDGGQTWRPLAVAAAVLPWGDLGEQTGRFAACTEYLRFEPNAPKDAAGRSRALWLGDALGPWVCQDLDADVTNWKLVGRGRGGSRVSAVACPPGLPGSAVAPLLAGFDGRPGGPAVGGFRYVNGSAVPERPLTYNDRRDVYGLGKVGRIAFCESDPRVVVAVGGWGTADIHPPYTGGGTSTDNGVTWTPFGDKGDGLTDPGLPDLGGPGEVAVGSARPAGGFPDLVWVPDDRPPRRSVDGGRTWADATGAFGQREAESSPLRQTLAADPVGGRTFYRLAVDVPDKRAGLFASVDGGATWERRAVLPVDERISLPHLAILRCCPGRAGDLWLSLDESSTRPAKPIGLYRSADGGRTWARVAPWRRTFGVAFGAPAPGRPNPSLALAAESPDGRFGIYLSDDATALAVDRAAEATWRVAWDPATTDVPAIVACLRTIGADRQSYGRIHAGATGVGRGLFYGEPVPSAPPAAPTNVTAAAVAGGVKVEWSDPVGAAEYDVQRQAVGPDEPGVGVAPATAPAVAATRDGTATLPAAPTTRPAEWRTVVTSTWQARFVDTSAEPGARYRYRVVASNAFGRSDPSAAAPSPLTPPGRR